MHRIKRRYPAILFLSLLSTMVVAQQKVDLPELSSKVKGPFYRGHISVMQGKMEYEDFFTASGTGIGFGVQIGQQISSKVALYTSFDLFTMPNPSISNSMFTANTMGLTEVGAGGALYTGKGKSYFFTDFNYAVATVTNDNSSGSSKGGLGINIGFGYEYNLFSRWDLGAAICYHYSTMKDKPSTELGEPTIVNNYVGARITLRLGPK